MIAALDPSERFPTHVTTVTKFMRFFRIVAGLDVDKQDLKRYSDFINRKVHDVLLCGEEYARVNGRDIIRPFDLPITKGLQQCIRAFDEIDQKVELAPILDHLTARPPLGLNYSEEMEHGLARVARPTGPRLARRPERTARRRRI
jgi:hypothetical protein